MDILRALAAAAALTVNQVQKVRTRHGQPIHACHVNTEDGYIYVIYTFEDRSFEVSVINEIDGLDAYRIVIPKTSPLRPVILTKALKQHGQVILTKPSNSATNDTATLSVKARRRRHSDSDSDSDGSDTDRNDRNDPSDNKDQDVGMTPVCTSTADEPVTVSVNHSQTTYTMTVSKMDGLSAVEAYQQYLNNRADMHHQRIFQLERSAREATNAVRPGAGTAAAELRQLMAAAAAFRA